MEFELITAKHKPNNTLVKLRENIFFINLPFKEVKKMPKYEIYGKVEIDVLLTDIKAGSYEEALEIAEDKYRYHGQILLQRKDFVKFHDKKKLYIENKGGYITWYGGVEMEEQTIGNG